MFFWREKEVSYFVCMTEDSYCFDKVLNKQYYWSYLWLWIGEDLVLLNVCLSRKERKFFGRDSTEKWSTGARSHYPGRSPTREIGRAHV